MKERIIGAIVLVLFVVLVVPVFLDGPPEGTAMVTEQVQLPGQAAGENRTVVLERDRETPVPAAVSAPGAGPATEPAAATVKPAVAPPARAESEKAQDRATERAAQSEPAEAAPSATGMWAVQLGSFGERENAERLAAELRKQGFAAFLSQLSNDGGQLHRVRVGPQKDRQSAEAMAGRLGKAGYKGQVVPHP